MKPVRLSPVVRRYFDAWMAQEPWDDSRSDHSFFLFVKSVGAVANPLPSLEEAVDFLGFYTGDPVPETARWKPLCGHCDWQLMERELFPRCPPCRPPTAWAEVRTGSGSGASSRTVA